MYHWMILPFFILLGAGAGFLASPALKPVLPPLYETRGGILWPESHHSETQAALLRQNLGQARTLPSLTVKAEGQFVMVRVQGDQAYDATVASLLERAVKRETKTLSPITETSPPALPYDLALQRWIEAQIMVRDAQRAHAQTVMPMSVPGIIPDSLDAQIQKQNFDIATDRFEATGRLDGIEEGYLSPLYHSLTAQLVELKASLAGEQVTYGHKHPSILRLKRQIYTLNSALRDESSLILQRMERSLPVHHQSAQADTELNDTETLPDLDALKASLQKAEQDYRAAKQARDASGLSLSALEPQEQPRILPVTVRPIPQTQLTTLFGCLIGLTVGLTILIAIRLSNRTISTADELEETLGHPVYASIPSCPSAAQLRKDSICLPDYVLKHAQSALAESLRHIRTNIRLRHKGLEAPRVIALTSALPEEGKTSLTAMLATICAQSGDRVLVIDADLRRPSQHKIFNVKPKHGLVDILTGRTSLSDTIDKKHETGVHLITARATPSHALTLIDSAKFWQLIREVRGDYDLVFIDTPCLLNFSDGLIISNLSDLTLFVAQWKRSVKGRITQALTPFKGVVTGPVAGVLTGIKPRAHQKNVGYGDYSQKS